MILLTQICLIREAKFGNIPVYSRVSSEPLRHLTDSRVSYEPLRHLTDIKASNIPAEESMNP